MASRITSKRRRALIQQSHCCYYCGFPMWEGNPEQFARLHKITRGQARWLQSTVEHVEPKQSGGKNTKQNIVAACLRCNSQRHVGKRNPAADAYRQVVQRAVTGA